VNIYNELQGITGVPVDIIGINEITGGQDSRMYASRPLTWLRDTSALQVEAAWGNTWRDLVILDPLNRRVVTYNLSPGFDDLSVAANYTKVKNALNTAATLTDTDGDKLPDYWELWAFGNLSKNGSSLLPDGAGALQHYAHGSAFPLSGAPAGLPLITTFPDGLGGTTFSVNWRGRRGTALGLTLVPEFSNTLSGWTGSTDFEEYSRRRLYDGSGAERIEWRSVVPNPVRFIRVRATLAP
jgi:hypothetical protein